MNVDEWAQSVCEEGLVAGAIAGVQRACEEIIRWQLCSVHVQRLCEELFVED